MFLAKLHNYSYYFRLVKKILCHLLILSEKVLILQTAKCFFTLSVKFDQSLYYMYNTAEEYKTVLNTCKDVFNNKMLDYGSAWRIMRTESLTDQIYIKANRIRSIQRKKETLVNEGVEPEFIGIVNYSAMAVIQLNLGVTEKPDLDSNEAVTMYSKVLDEAFYLMQRKNHDYDEAWRNMRISSMTDLILMKLLRIKSIEDNNGKTVVSEGLDANYFDIINYAVFCLILINERK